MKNKANILFGDVKVEIKKLVFAFSGKLMYVISRKALVKIYENRENYRRNFVGNKKMLTFLRLKKRHSMSPIRKSNGIFF